MRKAVTNEISRRRALKIRDGPHVMNPRNEPLVLQVHELPEGWCDVVGDGRMGRAIAAALRAAGVATRGPLGRNADASGSVIVLLCVPDREIANASAAIAPGPLVGHLSGSAALSVLEPHERFTIHPLLSVVGADASFRGAAAAIDGSSARALDVARALATSLGMRPRVIDREHRSLYHAAASAASNYLITVLALAERLAAETGLERSDLEPLVSSTLEHWKSLGAARALTGPIVRKDEGTVATQRAAVLDHAPETIALWDALVAGTRELARQSNGSNE